MSLSWRAFASGPKTVRLIAHLFIGLTALRALASRPLPIPSLTISTTSCRVSSLVHSFAHDSLKPLDVRKISSPPLRTNSHITLVPTSKLSSPPTSLTPLMSFPSRSQIYWSILGSNLLLSVAMNSPPSLIIIDALDEIEDEGGSGFLRDLLQVINQNDLHGLKFLVTSRQDPTIVSLCESFNSKRVCHLHEVDTQEVKKDIMTNLTDKLSALQAERDLGEFAQQADGLFIYAATGVRYISPSYPKLALPEQCYRLKKLLQAWPQPTNHKSAMLVDMLYHQILTSTLSELDDDLHASRLEILHAILCARTCISASTIADLLGADKDVANHFVQSLHPVLYISTKDNSIYWYHVSFQDFIFDPH